MIFSSPYYFFYKIAPVIFCQANDSTFQWRHTWAAQFCPNDSKLMVSGVVSDIRGEIAIFDTGRYSESRPSRKSNQHGLYKILNRVVNDPYDMLGCWCSDRFFLSATFDFQPSEIASSIYTLPWKVFSAFIDFRTFFF